MGHPGLTLLGKNTDPENKGLSKFDPANKGLSDAYPEGESAERKASFQATEDTFHKKNIDPENKGLSKFDPANKGLMRSSS